MKKKIIGLLLAIGIPVVYALLLRVIFGVNAWVDLFSVMTMTFLFCLPTIVGALTVYFSEMDKVCRLSFRIFAPWIPIFIFLIITLVLSLEGWACWLMVLPLFLVAASIGGLIGGYFKQRKDDNKLSVTVLMLLPLLLSPIEQAIEKVPGTYEAYTFIDIKAPAETIWKEVTSVSEIPDSDDSGWLNKILGFPRPVKAELNFEGVGAYREAVFTDGLVFHEKVYHYIDNKLMEFEIKAIPHEIPSTTLDEHVVVGGDYFDVLNGKYELEKLGEENYRLHLTSRFKMRTTFNFYAGIWARWIMKDIQNNILKIEKKRAELIFNSPSDYSQK